MSFSIRQADSVDWPSVRQLLDAGGLPTSDLSAERMVDFLVAETTRGDLVGSIGIECYGRSALLRSLVIRPNDRRSGIGRALIERIEDVAAGRGVHEIWLLTNDAAGFFERFGYAPRKRAEVPASIGRTPEFSSLCPDTATLMLRRLGN